MPTRIVITVPWGERLGGAESFLWTFLRHVDRDRLRPQVTFFQPGPFEREVAGLGFDTAVIETGRIREPRRAVDAVLRLRTLLLEERPDLLVNWMGKTHLYGAAAARLAGMHHRVVWWQHGLPHRNWLDRVATALPARAIGCPSVASATSQGRMHPRRLTFVVYPGVEDAVPMGPAERDALRREVGIEEDHVVIGIVGRLQPWKGQDRFLRAIARLRDERVRVFGLIVGGDAYGLSPDYAAGLHRFVDRRVLRECVSFTGQTAAARSFIQLMDVMVSATTSEPFGIVVLEAMAAGVPVVAVRSGGPAEILGDGQGGLLVPSGDERSLAAGIRELVDDPALRGRLGAAGLTRFRARFTAERMAREVEDRLIELARAPG